MSNFSDNLLVYYAYAVILFFFAYPFKELVILL